MTAPQMPPTGRGHAPRPRIAAGVWLVLISALAVVNSVGLFRLAEQSRSSAKDAHVQTLGTRVADLEQQAEALKHQPKPVARADLESVRQGLEERLVQFEQTQAAQTPSIDLEALQSRVGDIESGLKKAATPSAGHRRIAEPSKPKAPEQPFNVVGVELRGGERLLSVISANAASMLYVRLLREGDAVGAWHLQAIETRAAVFRVDGRTQRIALP